MIMLSARRLTIGYILAALLVCCIPLPSAALQHYDSGDIRPHWLTAPLLYENQPLSTEDVTGKNNEDNSCILCKIQDPEENKLARISTQIKSSQLFQAAQLPIEKKQSPKEIYERSSEDAEAQANANDVITNKLNWNTISYMKAMEPMDLWKMEIYGPTAQGTNGRANQLDALTNVRKRDTDRAGLRDIIIKRSKWDTVGDSWGKRSDWDTAGAPWGKRSKWNTAGDSWGKRNNWNIARDALNKRSKWDTVGDSWGKKRNWDTVGDSWGKRSKWNTVGDAWGKRNRWDIIDNLRDERSNWNQVGNLFGRKVRWNEVGDPWGKRSSWDTVGDSWGKRSEQNNQADWWIKPFNRDVTKSQSNQKRKWDTVGDSWGKRYKWDKSGQDKKWQSVGDSWGKRSKWDTFGDTWGKRSKWDIVGDSWGKRSDRNVLEDILGIKNKLYVAGGTVSKSSDWGSARSSGAKRDKWNRFDATWGKRSVKDNLGDIWINPAYPYKAGSTQSSSSKTVQHDDENSTLETSSGNPDEYRNIRVSNEQVLDQTLTASASPIRSAVSYTSNVSGADRPKNLAKRHVWESYGGAWGKRPDWENFNGSWGKRERWVELRGGWGKRNKSGRTSVANIATSGENMAQNTAENSHPKDCIVS